VVVLVEAMLAVLALALDMGSVVAPVLVVVVAVEMMKTTACLGAIAFTQVGAMVNVIAVANADRILTQTVLTITKPGQIYSRE
jgi:hypothetical protein